VTKWNTEKSKDAIDDEDVVLTGVTLNNVENKETKQIEGEEETEREEYSGDNERVFPDAFYCPITGELMKDPVVHPDGTSFERGSVVASNGDTDGGVLYYPNRALQAIIQNEVLLRNLPLQRTIDNTRKLLRDVVGLPPLPEQYYCSITFDIMKNPVIDPDGHTFERRAIVNWIRVNGNSPTTRNPLTVKQLYKNTAIRNLLDEETGRDEDSMHPSIREFKEERAKDTEEIALDEDLEEGNYNTYETPTSFGEIEELERQRQHRGGRETNFKFCFTMLMVVFMLAFLYFPHITILIAVLLLLVFFGTRKARRLRRET